jgi:hypothetical protein
MLFAWGVTVHPESVEGYSSTVTEQHCQASEHIREFRGGNNAEIVPVLFRR